ncbi:MAG: DUF4157 domain-containing protein [Acidobacteriota bacterium]
MGGILQRKCASCGQHTVAGGGCSDCEKKKGLLQRRASSSEATSEVPPIVHEVLRSSGQPLDASTRAFMGPRFGHDFSGVRVHADTRAAESAQAVNALAYTMGKNVVFDQGLYDPHSDSGHKLLAHELAHVVQQQGETALPASKIKIGSPSDPAEKAADRLAAEVTASSRFNPASTSNNGGTTRQERGTAGTLQRVVNERKVGCRNTGIPSLGLTGADAVQAIRQANEEAIVMSQRAENLLFFERLTFGIGAPDPDFTTILNEELGLDINNAADRRRTEIVERRFAAIRTRVLESDFTGYTCIGAAAVSLASGTPAAVAGECCTGSSRACSASGVSHMVLCRPWWTGDAPLRPGTLIHEPFHMFFNLDDFTNAKLNDAHCYTAFAERLAGVAPFASCAGR